MEQSRPLAADYVFSVYNQTEFTNRFVAEARRAVQAGNLDEAVALLREAQEPAAMAVSELDLAIGYLTKPPAPRFPRTYCSHCGGEFGPGDHGFSHCESHAGMRSID